MLAPTRRVDGPEPEGAASDGHLVADAHRRRRHEGPDVRQRTETDDLEQAFLQLIEEKVA